MRPHYLISLTLSGRACLGPDPAYGFCERFEAHVKQLSRGRLTMDMPWPRRALCRHSEHRVEEVARHLLDVVVHEAPQHTLQDLELANLCRHVIREEDMNFLH